VRLCTVALVPPVSDRYFKAGRITPLVHMMLGAGLLGYCMEYSHLAGLSAVLVCMCMSAVRVCMCMSAVRVCMCMSAVRVCMCMCAIAFGNVHVVILAARGCGCGCGCRRAHASCGCMHVLRVRQYVCMCVCVRPCWCMRVCVFACFLVHFCSMRACPCLSLSIPGNPFANYTAGPRCLSV